MSNYYYLDVSLKIISQDFPIDEYRLKNLIRQGLTTLFGECGAAIEVDILKYVIKDKRAILRCLASFYVKVRASLSFLSESEGLKFSFHVNKASSSLLSLQSDSRKYVFV